MTDLRVTARLLPVAPDGSVLLLEELDPADPEDRYWTSIGGALDPGETHEQAALRELREETGIVGTGLIGPVHEGTHSYSWGGVDYVARSKFFALPLGQDAEVSFDSLEPEEVGTVLGAGWWTPEGLRAHGAFRGPDLPTIMETAIEAVRRGVE